jgi:hypothetical protein
MLLGRIDVHLGGMSPLPLKTTSILFVIPVTCARLLYSVYRRRIIVGLAT